MQVPYNGGYLWAEADVKAIQGIGIQMISLLTLALTLSTTAVCMLLIAINRKLRVIHFELIDMQRKKL
jgi:hypothetical protein